MDSSSIRAHSNAIRRFRKVYPDAELAARGMSNEEIAGQLGRPQGTVENHMAEFYAIARDYLSDEPLLYDLLPGLELRRHVPRLFRRLTSVLRLSEYGMGNPTSNPASVTVFGVPVELPDAPTVDEMANRYLKLLVLGRVDEVKLVLENFLDEAASSAIRDALHSAGEVEREKARITLEAVLSRLTELQEPTDWSNQATEQGLWQLGCLGPQTPLQLLREATRSGHIINRIAALIALSASGEREGALEAAEMVRNGRAASLRLGYWLNWSGDQRLPPGMYVDQRGSEGLLTFNHLMNEIDPANRHHLRPLALQETLVLLQHRPHFLRRHPERLHPLIDHLENLDNLHLDEKRSVTAVFDIIRRDQLP